MIKLLFKIFIGKNKNLSDRDKRTAIGTICGIVGVLLNVFLFAVKLICGFLSSSIAILADALNNLGDVGSSVVALLGFRLAKKKPDPEHPFGHGRYEYISGLVVSFIIILMGFELAKESISAIVQPTAIEYSLFVVIVLGVSVAVKLYMAFYNYNVGKRISSSAMRAVALDSISDAISTSVIFVVALLSDILPSAVDGWAGLCVSVLILRTGVLSFKETVSPLLGKSPDKEFVNRIHQIVMSHHKIFGIHDLIVHDYGPGRVMISLHAELPVSMDFDEAHDLIDVVEEQLFDQLGCRAIIHIDPVDSQDAETVTMKRRVIAAVKGLDSRASIHDFRMIKGNSGIKIVFDAVLPYDSSLESGEFADNIILRMKAYDPSINCVIRIDRFSYSFTENENLPEE